ncbi:RHS repeat-associated core domain-containing protein, partial [Pedobacter hiemivivus]
SWNGNGSDKYKEDYTYDGNGNILTLQRNGSGGSLMDSLSYTYNKVNGKLQNNRLSQLNDLSGSGNQSGELPAGLRNYGYDAIGNLIAEGKAGENSSAIEWNVYGKIKKVTLPDGSIIDYTYDAAGNRVSKKLGTLTTWYVRDAQGNSLGVYDNAGSVTNWKEQQLYGSSRLGMWKPNFNLATDSGKIKWNDVNLKFFELNNHLGNVLAVVSDNVSFSGGSPVPDVMSAQDYYPFGMIQPGRSFSSGNYRYGFNGKENDNEVKGDGNQQDYGMRIYDPRVGRFYSTDPLSYRYPDLSTYQFASNSPIENIDLDGLEKVSATMEAAKAATNRIIVKKAEEVGTRFAVDQAGRLIQQGSRGALAEALGGAGRMLGATLGTVINVLIPVPNDPNGGTEGAWLRKKRAAADLHATINHLQIFTNDPSTLSDQYLVQVRERLATGKAYASDYKYAQEANSRFGGQNKSDIEVGQGVVYLRIDKTGSLKPYIGQAKSLSRYEARQKEHDRANPESDFTFTIINLGSPGLDLNEKEQEALNALGGPTNKGNRDGGTSNKKNVIKQNKNGS